MQYQCSTCVVNVHVYTIPLAQHHYRTNGPMRSPSSTTEMRLQSTLILRCSVRARATTKQGLIPAATPIDLHRGAPKNRHPNRSQVSWVLSGSGMPCARRPCARDTAADTRKRLRSGRRRLRPSRLRARAVCDAWAEVSARRARDLQIRRGIPSLAPPHGVEGEKKAHRKTSAQ